MIYKTCQELFLVSSITVHAIVCFKYNYSNIPFIRANEVFSFFLMVDRGISEEKPWFRLEHLEKGLVHETLGLFSDYKVQRYKS